MVPLDWDVSMLELPLLPRVGLRTDFSALTPS